MVLGFGTDASEIPVHEQPPRKPITVLRPWEQVAVAVGSAVGALVNPARADFVHALSETTGGPAFHLILERMKASSEGQVWQKDDGFFYSASMETEALMIDCGSPFCSKY